MIVYSQFGIREWGKMNEILRHRFVAGGTGFPVIVDICRTPGLTYIISKLPSGYFYFKVNY